MAAPTIRNASGRPLRRSPAWSGRDPERASVPVRRSPPAGPPPLWRIVAGPLSFLAVALVVAGVMTAWMSSRAPAPPAAPPAARSEPELSAAEAVRLRFAPELQALRGADLPSSDFAERFGAGPQQAAAQGDRLSAYAPLATAPVVPEPGRARPPNALLNDAQIASIKSRLKLTAEQEKLWTPVETALRGIAWRRGADRRGSGPAALDAQSVERLKSAAAPLMGRLRDDQKREIRSLSHVMGLGDLAEKL